MKKAGGTIAVHPDETGIDVKEEINAFDPFATLNGSGTTQGMWGATNGADNW
ncbi:hypothetical protein [Salinispora vitiensis]|uniref:hypothetical protein n=1 Tax=Salinispora vitiensis TaxID=999544 RepID=UPI0003A12B64|nr:hypothetical protein [Salinispora vitiensis]